MLISRRNIHPKVGFKMGGEMATFGYARVSTRDQDLASHVAALQAVGCGNIFKEKASGAKTDRPELAKAIRRREVDDVLVVTRLDRLARSTRDLLSLARSDHAHGIGIRARIRAHRRRNGKRRRIGANDPHSFARPGDVVVADRIQCL